MSPWRCAPPGSTKTCPNASFAGQYETVLDVRGAEALVDAVQLVFASVFNPRLTVYRAIQMMQHY